MIITVSQSKQLGQIAKLVRKNQGLDQASAGMLSGNGSTFTSEFENVKLTVELGRVLNVLNALGVTLAFAGELRLPKKLAKMMVKKLISQIVPVSTALIEYVESLPTNASKPGEIRMLREIHFNCILEMTKRMEPN